MAAWSLISCSDSDGDSSDFDSLLLWDRTDFKDYSLPVYLRWSCGFTTLSSRRSRVCLSINWVVIGSRGGRDIDRCSSFIMLMREACLGQWRNGFTSYEGNAFLLANWDTCCGLLCFRSVKWLILSE